jgi:2-polyprenyl-6-methoxyphenol hydroxylase-like FAD-dependent oxidoreductase
VRILQGGREWLFTAGLVVGADGRHSTVARLVGAQEYLGYDARRAGIGATGMRRRSGIPTPPIASTCTSVILAAKRV